MAVFGEQLEVVRGLLGSAPFAFEGRHYRLAGVDARPRPVQEPSLPLIVGGSAKPRGAALAARFADEYNTVFATVDECRERRRVLEGAWRDAGRDPATLRFSLMTGCIVGRDRAEVEARTRAVGERRGEPGFAPPPAWIAGTVDEAARSLRDLAGAGVHRVMLQLLDHEDLDHIAVIGRELAPAAR
jgi:alkanesulfonate monooxygenase SsuD/methylene tetrahydromethanopterin reductase-like flavin-dependent oxidoreductase (luciferase family)